MKTKENYFFIDELIVKYQKLSNKEKAILNVSILICTVLFIVNSFYNGGKVVGEFIYFISH